MQIVIVVVHALFLSTLSLRRATRANRLADTPPQISIHALLAESDAFSQSCAKSTPEISIHALLAESDVGQKRLRQKLAISIHALLAESDIKFRVPGSIK